ncbi:MAG: porin family protein [Acidobacteriia bacterium]|nr:porin family protein [Terriglobia bacterium]
MSANRLAFLIVLLSVLALRSLAQRPAFENVNQISVTVGRTFVSTQTIQNPTDLPPTLHFANEESFALNYSRQFKGHGFFAFSGELPVAIYPRMDLATPSHGIPKDIGALFITPSARVNFFAGDTLSPWVSVGGGYARFREASTLNFYGTNPGPRSTNTGAIQFGLGLDVWPWNHWGIRTEARDFYSGVPDLNLKTGNNRQHNYYVGVGVIRRF